MAMASPKQSNNDSFQGGFALDLSQGEEAYGTVSCGTVPTVGITPAFTSVYTSA